MRPDINTSELYVFPETGDYLIGYTRIYYVYMDEDAIAAALEGNVLAMMDWMLGQCAQFDPEGENKVPPQLYKGVTTVVPTLVESGALERAKNWDVIAITGGYFIDPHFLEEGVPCAIENTMLQFMQNDEAELLGIVANTLPLQIADCEPGQMSESATFTPITNLAQFYVAKSKTENILKMAMTGNYQWVRENLWLSIWK